VGVPRSDALGGGGRQWRSQDLVVVGALMGWSMGRGVSSPWEGVWGEGCAHLPKEF